MANPGEPRIVFLPGAGGDARFWEPVAERLPTRRSMVRLEWPGLGNVPHAAGVTSFDDLVRLTLAELERPADLVAQSMGGVVAIRAALARPNRVRRLVLVATSGGMDLTPYGVEDWRPDYRREYPNAAPWITEARPDFGTDLSAVTAPALLIWGDADPISPPAVGRALARQLRHADLVVIRGGTHALARERADEVATHIARHLCARMDA